MSQFSLLLIERDLQYIRKSHSRDPGTVEIRVIREVAPSTIHSWKYFVTILLSPSVIGASPRGRAVHKQDSRNQKGSRKTDPFHTQREEKSIMASKAMRHHIKSDRRAVHVLVPLPAPGPSIYLRLLTLSDIRLCDNIVRGAQSVRLATRLRLTHDMLGWRKKPSNEGGVKFTGDWADAAQQTDTAPD
ncbi:hypothetical protein J6590_057735 [Homalodisca vitripennis]|nr:hypothetical protein J6590_057735 [Homalodisca vitripennis]